MRVLYLISFIFVLFTEAYSQNIRGSHSSKLLVDESSVYEFEVPQSQFVIGDSIIQLYPGEKLMLEADLVGNKLCHFKVVQQVADKSKTIIIEFLQISNAKQHKQMKLAITNPFGKTISYVAYIYLMKHNEWVQTNVIPVGSKKTSYEFWPDIITTITLSNLRVSG